MVQRVYRQCSLCESMRPAREFTRAEGPGHGADRPTRCPVCGRVGPLREFRRAEQPIEAAGRQERRN